MPLNHTNHVTPPYPRLRQPPGNLLATSCQPRRVQCQRASSRGLFSAGSSSYSWARPQPRNTATTPTLAEGRGPQGRPQRFAARSSAAAHRQCRISRPGHGRRPHTARGLSPLNPLKLLAEGQPGQALTYSGISVELASDRVFLDDKRRAKWAAKLRLALAADRLSSERAQSVHGIMQRAARVFPELRASLFPAAPALLLAGCCCCAAKAAVADLKEQASRDGVCAGAGLFTARAL